MVLRLVLEPLNGTFATKTLDVSAGPIKVGRKMNSKHASERTNGIFDSKVLSRSHAEIWYEDGKVLIRDVGSSNGTYLNGVRLSEEGKPGKPCEIVSGDEIVFGIDIATDEQMTGTFQKVACLARLMDPADIKMPIPSPAREYNSNRLSDSHRFGGLRLDNILNILDDEIRRATTANLEIEQLKVTLADLDSIVNSNPPSSRDDGIFVPNRQQLQNGAEKSQRSATAVESAKPERTGTVLPDIMTIENERRSHKEALEVMEARVRAAVDEAQHAKTEQQKAVHQLEAELDGMKGNLASTVERCRELETKIAQLETEKACGETSFSNDLEAWRVRALKAEGDLEHFKQRFPP
ncbi:hypothetical protein DFJ73DRAFT_311215 [Zopfochytrium polystomum]|nr:hypothetical protein DFJ73DRAFT_311215 [Zopfochytrium polystomum]